MKQDDVYRAQGFESRTDYLQSLADDYELPLEDVQMIACLLGSSEDFDGLVTTLEDYVLQRGHYV